MNPFILHIFNATSVNGCLTFVQFSAFNHQVKQQYLIFEGLGQAKRVKLKRGHEKNSGVVGQVFIEVQNFDDFERKRESVQIKYAYYDIEEVTILVLCHLQAQEC